MCVSERAGGGGGGRSGAALKTNTPHVNVGNKKRGNRRVQEDKVQVPHHGRFDLLFFCLRSSCSLCSFPHHFSQSLPLKKGEPQDARPTEETMKKRRKECLERKKNRGKGKRTKVA